jgi:hypothetical protein
MIMIMMMIIIIIIIIIISHLLILSSSWPAPAARINAVPSSKAATFCHNVSDSSGHCRYIQVQQ